MKRLKKLAILATVAAAALLVATVAFGAAPGDDGKVLACSVKYGPHKGEARFMDSSTATCHTSERPVMLAAFVATPTPEPTPTPTPTPDTIRVTLDGIKTNIGPAINLVGIGFSDQEEIDTVSNYLFQKLKDAQ